MRQGFEFGWRGFYDDDQAIMKEWGFDPTTITVPFPYGSAIRTSWSAHARGVVGEESADGAQALLRRRRARLVGRQPPRRTVRGDQDDVCVKRV